jgi:solute carrier family 35, member E1
MVWYFASVMSSTSSKQILATFPKPITLTVLQFAFVAGWCLLISYTSSVFPSLKHRVPALKNGIIAPNAELCRTCLKLTAFMIGGHILSSDAISRIDVSLVHTIKGLSPLFTVAAYRFFYRKHFNLGTYLSLIPLTCGVFLACSTNFSANFLGICSAFASAITFVTQNIVSKRIFNAAALAELQPSVTKKPDKLNLLCYSSIFALAFTLPIWLWSEGMPIIMHFFSSGSLPLSTKKGALDDHGALILEYIFNGTFHFTQSLSAFILLSMVTPVTYSVASLVKRVFVIVFSIIWFGSKVTSIQGFGIALTFLGLYLYDRTSDANKAERRTRLINGNVSNTTLPLLPVVEKDSPPPDVTEFTVPTLNIPMNGIHVDSWRPKDMGLAT